MTRLQWRYVDRDREAAGSTTPPPSPLLRPLDPTMYIYIYICIFTLSPSRVVRARIYFSCNQMPSVTRSGGRALAERRPRTFVEAVSTVGRGRPTTTARGSTTTPRRGKNATNVRRGQSPPATNEQVTLASLVTLMSEIQAAQVMTTYELRPEVAKA